MKQFYTLFVREIFKYVDPVWYHKLTVQWKNEIQEVQNTDSRRI